jgi:hypothetical protein
MNTARSGLKRLSVMAGMILSAIGSNLAIAPANALTFNFIAGTGITAEQLTIRSLSTSILILQILLLAAWVVRVRHLSFLTIVMFTRH